MVSFCFVVDVKIKNLRRRPSDSFGFSWILSNSMSVDALSSSSTYALCLFQEVMKSLEMMMMMMMMIMMRLLMLLTAWAVSVSRQRRTATSDKRASIVWRVSAAHWVVRSMRVTVPATHRAVSRPPHSSRYHSSINSSVSDTNVSSPYSVRSVLLLSVFCSHGRAVVKVTKLEVGWTLHSGLGPCLWSCAFL